MELLEFSKSKAYEVIRILNIELEQKGFKTEKGRVLKEYFEKRYGLERGE
jgi:hypothetical protein